MSSGFPFVSLLMRYLNLPSSNVVLKATHIHLNDILIKLALRLPVLRALK